MATVPDEVLDELIAAATDAAEELYIAAQYSRRDAVKERWQRLLAALDAAKSARG